MLADLDLAMPVADQLATLPNQRGGGPTVTAKDRRACGADRHPAVDGAPTTPDPIGPVVLETEPDEVPDSE